MKGKRLKTVENINIFINKVEVNNYYGSSPSVGRELFVNAVGGSLGAGLFLLAGAIYQYFVAHPF